MLKNFVQDQLSFKTKLRKAQKVRVFKCYLFTLIKADSIRAKVFT